MRFITGPRQSGKTTLARMKLKREGNEALYYLWDLRSVRNRYKKNEFFFTQEKFPSEKKAWICFDEIHKVPKWKNILKGIYDTVHESYRFIITGSSKFDTGKLSGDSLSGRYFTFHLMPLSLAEVAGNAENLVSPPENAEDFVNSALKGADKKRGDLQSKLLKYSAFPEPFLSGSEKFYSKWSGDYPDTIIKEDISTLTRITMNEYLYDVYGMLGEMVSSPVSEASIASHLGVSPVTVKNYINKLEDFYLVFRLRPYSKNIKRSLLKAAKCYFYDYARINDEAQKFENYVALELNIRVTYWNDNSADRYMLFYVRSKEKKEVDFLIIKNSVPWLLVEAKLSDSKITGHYPEMQKALGGIPMVQLCRESGVRMMQTKNIFRISADRFFS